MNRIIAFVFVLALLLTSCGTAKKVRRNVEDSRLHGVSMTQETTERFNRSVDTTELQNGRITITEIEFFEPDVIDAPAPGGKYADAFRRADSAFWESYNRKRKGGTKTNGALQGACRSNGGGVGVNLSGIKSIRQKVIETNVEKRGVSGETFECGEASSAEIVDAGETNVQESQEPTPDPYRWRYIFGIVLVVAVIAIGLNLCLKKTPILRWIKSIF
ncbi:MAG: hypothetical protein NC324_02450 [Bacteroides sp.]|nr:hypothetical protein [Bacteroides sp.]